MINEVVVLPNVVYGIFKVTFPKIDGDQSQLNSGKSGLVSFSFISLAAHFIYSMKHFSMLKTVALTLSTNAPQ